MAGSAFLRAVVEISIRHTVLRRGSLTCSKHGMVRPNASSVHTTVLYRHVLTIPGQMIENRTIKDATVKTDLES